MIVATHHCSAYIPMWCFGLGASRTDCVYSYLYIFISTWQEEKKKRENSLKRKEVTIVSCPDEKVKRFLQYLINKFIFNKSEEKT